MVAPPNPPPRRALERLVSAYPAYVVAAGVFWARGFFSRARKYGVSTNTRVSQTTTRTYSPPNVGPGSAGFQERARLSRGGNPSPNTRRSEERRVGKESRK